MYNFFQPPSRFMSQPSNPSDPRDPQTQRTVESQKTLRLLIVVGAALAHVPAGGGGKFEADLIHGKVSLSLGFTLIGE
jgi:hypothetical protein